MTDLEPTSATSTRPTALEWVKALPSEDREVVLIELLKELVRTHGDAGRIDVETNDDDYLGFFVPAEAERREAERVLPAVGPMWTAELHVRRARLNAAVPIRDLIGTPTGEARPPRSE